MEQIAAQKAELRRQLRKARREMDREVLARESEQLRLRLLELPELQRSSRQHRTLLSLC